MPVRRILAVVWTVGVLGAMVWFWATYSGPYRWAAEWQLARFGSYGEKITLLGPLLVLMIPAALLGGRRPWIVPHADPAVRAAHARRNAGILALLGFVVLLAGAAAGGLGYLRLQTPLTSADLVLITGTEPEPATDLVRVTGIARTDLIVGFEETIAGQARRSSFVPLTAPSWRPGEPIRFILRTNQTAWMPRDGAGAVQMLRRSNPPFRMVTEPSVLTRYHLPGVVKAEYEKARIVLDPSVALVEQSKDEVYAPYWIAAALGGLVGLCLMLGGAIGWGNARKAASIQVRA